MRAVLERVILLACLAVLGMGVAVVSLPQAVHAQAHSKRLVLKDGSYQAATKWETKGDRVRYYSAERFEWEELPRSLIDWPATEKYNTSLAEPEAAAETRAVDAEERAERQKLEAATPLVAPGVRLPDQSGVFVLDTFHGQPQLVEVVQNGGEVNKQTGKNMLRAAVIPIPISKQTVELKGTHATIQAHVADPVIFAKVDSSASNAVDSSGEAATPADRELAEQIDRYRLVRVQQKPDKRVVANLTIGLTGHVKEQESFIKTAAQPVSGGWVKITPQEQLTPGEYALVEMLGPKQMNLFVWDFGVNPSAPQNASAWKPAPVKETRTGTSDSPVLKKH